MFEKTCFDCGNTLISSAAFCAYCGKDVRRKVKTTEDLSSNRNGTELSRISIAAMIAKSKREHEEWTEKAKAYNQKHLQIYRRGFVILSLIFVAILIFVPTFALIFYFYGAYLVFHSCFFRSIDLTPTQTEYYQFSHSRFNGQHRCIFCGHSGIYKKGVYASSRVDHNCSKCGEELFYS